jgi:hypothetical protein
MMQAADLRERDGSSYPAWLDRARVRTILVKRKMRAGALVIVDVRVENSAQMAVLRKNNSLWLETRIVLRDFTETSVDERGPVAWWAQCRVG